MNITELLAYIEVPALEPVILEVGILLMKTIYHKLEPADIDRAKVLVYEKDITADWLEILAEGNPDYLDDVTEQLHYDFCLSEETSLVFPTTLDLGCPIVDSNLDIYLSRLDKETEFDLDTDEIHYLADEFGIQIDEGILYDPDDEGEIE